tara:strand:+ start:331 stop:666 length:336 start_codon:yes stop_codon:yes gene_type:complete
MAKVFPCLPSSQKGFTIRIRKTIIIVLKRPIVLKKSDLKGLNYNSRGLQPTGIKDTSSLNTEGVEQLLVIPDGRKSESRKRYLGFVTLWLKLRSATGIRIIHVKTYRFYWD